MRRKPGALIPIEVSILSAARDLECEGTPEFHGYALARRMRAGDAARRLTAQGTLYEALARMEAAGLLRSRWEKQAIAVAARRPARRLYRLTPAGVRALAKVEPAALKRALRERPAQI